MRSILLTLLLVLVAAVAAAQSPYPVTPQPAPVWGGYNLPAQVPYQPTLDGATVNGVAPEASQPWQPYVAAPLPAPPGATGIPQDSVYLDGPMPPQPQELAPGVPLYPGTTEPDLKASLIPPGARNGFFQGVNLDAAYLPPLGSFNLGWTDLHADVVTALPFFTRENPIIITPSYTAHFLDRPLFSDLPEQLNDVAVDFHIFRVYDNHWIADFAVTPGLFADNNSFDSGDAFRVNGRAVGVYAPNIELKYALGVTYVDGGWNKVVPVAGVIYKPNDDVEYTLVFPTPRISWRLPWSPIPGKDERRMYIALDYLNSAWAFEKSNGAPDVLSARDYRLILGFERNIVHGLSHRVEIAYVFNRDIKIASVGSDDISMNDTLMVRAGISY